MIGGGRLGVDLPDEFKNYLIAKHPLGRFNNSQDITGASIPVDGGYLVE